MTCEHGFIGPCAECDGAGQEPEVPRQLVWCCLYCSTPIPTGDTCDRPACVAQLEAARRRMGMSGRRSDEEERIDPYRAGGV